MRHGPNCQQGRKPDPYCDACLVLVADLRGHMNPPDRAATDRAADALADLYLLGPELIGTRYSVGTVEVPARMLLHLLGKETR